MIDKQCFIHKFRSKNNNYVYDINTNHIIEVDKIVYDIIEYCGVLSPSEIVEKFRWKYDINEIQERINSIDQAIDDGLFSHLYPNIECQIEPEIMEWELNNYISLLILEVASKSNLQCINHSYSNKCHRLGKYLQELMCCDLARNCIDHYLSHSSESRNININFCGGEPLLNFEVIKHCVNYVNKIAQGKKRHYTIITNGILLDTQTVKFLVANDFNIIVNLDNPLEIYSKNSLYGNDDIFGAIKRNLIMIKEQYSNYYAEKVSFNGIMFDLRNLIEKDNFILYSDLLANHPLYLRYSESTYIYCNDNLMDFDDKIVKADISNCIDFHVVNELEGGDPYYRMAPSIVNEDLLKKIYLRTIFDASKRKHYLDSTYNTIGFYATVEGKFFLCGENKFEFLNFCIDDIESSIKSYEILNLVEQINVLLTENCHRCWSVHLCDISKSIIFRTNRFDLTHQICDVIRKSINNALIIFCSILERDPKAFDRWENIRTTSTIIENKPYYIQENKMFLNPLDSVISPTLFKFGVYEPFETELVIKHVKRGNIVLDIGANIGYYTLILAKLVGNEGRVFAFEPDPTNFAFLEKNMRINNYQNITLIQKAVMNVQGSVHLYLGKDNKGDHRTYDSHDGRESIEVGSITLDGFIEDYDKDIDFIKIDIQGAEEAALLGAISLLKKNKKLKIITEFWPWALKTAGYDPEEYLNLLVEYGFKIYDINERDKITEPVRINELLKKYTLGNGDQTNLICIK